MTAPKEAAGRSMCRTCHGFGYIGDGPFTCGAKCHDCGGSGTHSMTVPDEAVEAAARAYQSEVSYTGAPNWDDLTEGRQLLRVEWMLTALTAAAPFIAAQATSIIADLIDNDPCSFDHNHSCQAHGHYYLAQGEACPQHEAKEWVKTYRSGT